jgi:hypothetical protein
MRISDCGSEEDEKHAASHLAIRNPKSASRNRRGLRRGVRACMIGEKDKGLVKSV